MKKSILFLGLLGVHLCYVMFTSCTKDTDASNWSPTQAVPADSTDENTDVPNDTLSADTNAFAWHVLIIGDDAFNGDSNTVQYVFDSVSALHIFNCTDALGREMIVRLPDLNPGEHTISFANSTYLALLDDTLLFDTSFLPNGSVYITKNSNGRISALFESDLYDIGGSGQVKNLVNGAFSNVSYE